MKLGDQWDDHESGKVRGRFATVGFRPVTCPRYIAKVFKSPVDESRLSVVPYQDVRVDGAVNNNDIVRLGSKRETAEAWLIGFCYSIRNAPI